MIKIANNMSNHLLLHFDNHVQRFTISDTSHTYVPLHAFQSNENNYLYQTNHIIL